MKPIKFLLTFLYLNNLLKDSVKCFKLRSKVSPSIAFRVDRVRNRSTEVTVNKNDGSYNQHMHVLLCVESKYFRGSENYISQNDWIDFWQKDFMFLFKQTTITQHTFSI